MARKIIMTNMMGSRTLHTFSIPPLTPRRTMKVVMSNMTASHRIIWKGFAVKLPNMVVISSPDMPL